jgi:hypothetical protein
MSAAAAAIQPIGARAADTARGAGATATGGCWAGDSVGRSADGTDEARRDGVGSGAPVSGAIGRDVAAWAAARAAAGARGAGVLSSGRGSTIVGRGGNAGEASGAGSGAARVGAATGWSLSTGPAALGLGADAGGSE